MSTTVGLLHPGEMGSSVGAAARVRGARVLWVSQGRSTSTRIRAEQRSFEEMPDLETLLRSSEIVFAICPPHAARKLAHRVARVGFRGCYVDANAVSPETAREIGTLVVAGGARFVDGGIIGPPVRRPGMTRLYLAGDGAPEVAALFEAGALEAITLPGPVGSASALKICFAAWTKGTTALLMAIRALAEHEGVDPLLLREWQRSIPELPGRSDATASSAPKAWRFVGEMQEIAASFARAGLPDGFHVAAGQVFEQLEKLQGTDAPSIEEIKKRLLKGVD